MAKNTYFISFCKKDQTGGGVKDQTWSVPASQDIPYHCMLSILKQQKLTLWLFCHSALVLLAISVLDELSFAVEAHSRTLEADVLSLICFPENTFFHQILQ